ncbi:hypothetical protein [Parvularcula sp. IMCC14364]|uniref:hypothetical protein n=1 Tax=Parvularcula sp. IMCC14364 TaxID=3067902 RepID=UPI00274235D3|nr:hypothetical protein [Parvularcula sp. IMCC14364]
MTLLIYFTQTNMTRDPIISAADRVQAMPQFRRALLAREALIAGASKTVAFGPREGRLRRLLAATGRGGMVVVSLVLLLGRYFAGCRVATKKVMPEAIFLGIGAMREQMLRADIQAQLGTEPHFVDELGADGFAALPRPSLTQVIRHWMRAMHEALEIYSEPDPDFKPLDLLSTLTMRLHELAYLLALFERLHETRPQLLIYSSTAGLAAYAACLAGFKVEYRQHGLLARTLVFPEFCAMVALTAFEGRYVASRIHGLALRLNKPPAALTSLPKVFAFAGDYEAKDPSPVTELAEVALVNGFHVIVRPHPRGHNNLWDDIRGRDGVDFDTDGRFEDFLGKWRPAFVASWISTTLLDGLQMGAVPVTLSRDNRLLLLPIDTIAFSWPQQRALIESIMRDSEERQRAFESLSENLQP